MLTRIRSWFQRRRLAATPFYERTRYSFDGITLRASDPLGGDQQLTCSDFVDVGVETSCLGPFVEDVFWLINREAEMIRVPQCSPVFALLLQHSESFAGFEWDAFAGAMACTEDRYFPCWSRATKREAT